MTLDERFGAYVRGHWVALIADVARLCPDADEVEAEELVLAALVRVAGRRRSRSADGEPDAAVRRRLVRGCDDRDKSRRQDRHDDFQLMDVGDPGRSIEPTQVDVETDVSLRIPAGDWQAAPLLLTADQALAAVERRVERSRRRHLIAVAAGVVVVVGLTSSAISSLGGKRTPPPRRVVASIGGTIFARNPREFANAVTAGGGYIWSIENQPTRRGSRSYVVERDPQSGQVENRYRVPSADDQIGYGLGKVWTWRNGNDTADTALATIQAPDDVFVQRSSPAIAISDVTFTSHRAWLTEPQVNSVTSYRDGMLGDPTNDPVSGAQFAVPVSPSSILVAGSLGALQELPGGQAVVDPAARSLTLLAAAPRYGFWIAHGKQLTYQAGLTVKPSVSLTLPHVVGAVSGDPKHGVFVALRSESPLHFDPYLVYYSPQALAEQQPPPTARLNGNVQAESMVADPAGGVVFATNEGAIGRWDPAGVPSTQLQRGSA